MQLAGRADRPRSVGHHSQSPYCRRMRANISVPLTDSLSLLCSTLVKSVIHLPYLLYCLGVSLCQQHRHRRPTHSNGAIRCLTSSPVLTSSADFSEQQCASTDRQTLPLIVAAGNGQCRRLASPRLALPSPSLLAAHVVQVFATAGSSLYGTVCCLLPVSNKQTVKALINQWSTGWPLLFACLFAFAGF